MVAIAVGSGVVAAVPAGASPVWTVVPSPNPSGSVSTSMSGVACPTTSSCFGVGTYSTASATKTLVEHWNGSTWTVMSSPSPSSYAFLSAVACPAAKDCFAVGTWTGTTVSRALIEHWNGSSWATVASPTVPTTAASLVAIACPSTTNCFAVSDYSAGGAVKTLIERWNGSKWAVMSSPNPSNYALLNGVKCAGAKSCFAVGSYGVAGKTLVEHWNGTNWKIVTSPNPSSATGSNLGAVTCATTTSCFAVGSFTTASAVNTLIERWTSGSGWHIVSSPNPATSTSSTPTAVACAGVANCFAVGFWHHSIATASKSLVEHWNGSKWSIMSSPNPGAAFTHLWSVACPGPQRCYAVGGESSSSNTKSLVERYA